MSAVMTVVLLVGVAAIIGMVVYCVIEEKRM